MGPFSPLIDFTKNQPLICQAVPLGDSLRFRSQDTISRGCLLSETSAAIWSLWGIAGLLVSHGCLPLRSSCFSRSSYRIPQGNWAFSGSRSMQAASCTGTEAACSPSTMPYRYNEIPLVCLRASAARIALVLHALQKRSESAAVQIWPTSITRNPYAPTSPS